MVLPAPTLALLRSLAEGAMIDECEILRLPLVRPHGVTGGLSGDFSVVATSACRVAQGWQPPFERAFVGGIASQKAVFVHLPLETEIHPPDRIRITAGNEAGRELEVTSAFARRSQDVQLTVLCQEVGT